MPDIDFRYDIKRVEEPDDNAHQFFIRVLETFNGEDTGVELDCFYCEDPYADLEAAREVQAMPDIEERWAHYAAMGL